MASHLDARSRSLETCRVQSGGPLMCCSNVSEKWVFSSYNAPLVWGLMYLWCALGVTSFVPIIAMGVESFVHVICRGCNIFCSPTLWFGISPLKVSELVHGYTVMLGKCLLEVELIHHSGTIVAFYSGDSWWTSNYMTSCIIEASIVSSENCQVRPTWA